MPIVPAEPIAALLLEREELEVVRDALAEYLSKGNRDKAEAAWSVLAAIATRVR